MDIPPLERVLADYRQRWRQSAITAQALTEGSFRFDAAGMTYNAAFVRGVAPGILLENLVSLSWHWKDAPEQVAGHRAALIVTPGKQDDKTVDAALGLTKIVATLVSTTDSIGVYWAEAALHEASVFLQEGEIINEGHPPVSLWIGCYFVHGPASAITVGMMNFGHREIIIPLQPSADFLHVVKLLYHFATFVLTSGRSLPEGFILQSERECRRVRYRGPDSEFTMPVMELEDVSRTDCGSFVN